MTTFQTSQPTGIILAPSYNIPIVLTLMAVPLFLVTWWLSAAIAIFGLFLMFQSVNIRLHFTPKALDIYRKDKLIRSFPYSEWQNWKIFWQPIPILFYFKEINSIHFLPILFDAKTLKTSLEKYIPLENNN
jgi:hypothetical protein